MVGSRGLEPPTSRLSGVRSNHLSYEPVSKPAPDFRPLRALLRRSLRLDGGDNRVRTDDPLLAKQVLSQLSYTPVFPLPALCRARSSFLSSFSLFSMNLKN